MSGHITTSFFDWNRWTWLVGSESSAHDLRDQAETISLAADDPRDAIEVRPVAAMSLEAVLGLLAAFFIGFSTPLMATAAAVALGWGSLGALITLSLSGWAAFLVARLASNALEGTDQRTFRMHRPDGGGRKIDCVMPLGLAMALRVPRYSVPWGGLLGLWWILHFAATALLAHFASVQLMQNAPAGHIVIHGLFGVAIHFSFLFAANLYLILSVAAFVNRPLIWLTFWRSRYVIDFGVAIALVMWR